jgi:hypothetical protein
MRRLLQKGNNTYILVYCKYIVRNGKRIYPTRAKCFRFWVKVK